MAQPTPAIEAVTPPKKSHWLRNTFLFLLAMLVALAAFIATRSDLLHVERSAQIDAPPEVVFAIINDLHQWDQWSPFNRDPKMKTTFEGPAEGPGASYAWDGNSEVGAGRMTIKESKPGELVSMDLEFSRPFACKNVVDFKLEPAAGGTRVSWIMEGPTNFMSKAMSLFMDMDKMVGDDFEQGLANLNTVAQKRAEQGQVGQASGFRLQATGYRLQESETVFVALAIPSPLISNPSPKKDRPCQRKLKRRQWRKKCFGLVGS